MKIRYDHSEPFCEACVHNAEVNAAIWKSFKAKSFKEKLYAILYCFLPWRTKNED